MQKPDDKSVSRALIDSALRVSASKSDVLKLLKLLGYIMSETLGDWCEIVIHDLADLEHSVVWIAGNVTGREVGSNITDLGLKQLRAGDLDPLIGYSGQTEDRRMLKSSSVFVCDDDGEPLFAFCINLDVTPVLLFESFLQSLSVRSEASETRESFSSDLRQTLQNMIRECLVEVNVPVSLMSKPERIKVVKLLDERGAFQVKKSIPIVASELGVSRRSIYNYLEEVE